MTELDALVRQMSLEEKAALCTGAGLWTTTPINHLNIPELTVSDGPHGVRKEAVTNQIISPSLPATSFPTASCMASTWSVDLIHKLGEAIAEECIALKVDVILGPGVNIKRTPLCGRNFEYYSEDPFLAGEMAVSFIQGVQSRGVGTSLKHFAVNNQETDRSRINAIVDERSLREVYLPAFEMAVKKAKPWTVMCSYNKINGYYSSENHGLLTDILKNEWGFEGLVVSDWGAVHDRVEALKAGIDLEMPGPRERRVKTVIQAVQNGDLDESILDEAVHRILSAVFKAAQIEKGVSFDIAAHHALARKVAAEGMVLLKNNGILPLRDQKTIAVIGRAAREAYYQGGGSSHINPTQVDIPIEELQKMARDARFSYAQGYYDDETVDQALVDEAVRQAQSAEVALIYICLPATKESEGYDRPDLDLTSQQVALIKAVTSVQPNTIVILNNGAPVVMKEWIDGTAAVLEAWMMGQAGGGAIADILFGRVNPSGKLAETFPLNLIDTPAFINFPGECGNVRYGEGIYVGYRYYDTKDIPVMFPFGYGLSYTTFKYSNPRCSADSFKDIDGLTVSVDVTNTGKVTGKEVVQVYVHDKQSELARPPKELKGFAKIELHPGETKTVQVALDFRSFAYFHPRLRQWLTEDGDFDILIGASSGDIRFCQKVSLKSTRMIPCLLNRNSTTREWVEDIKGNQILEGFIQNLPTHVKNDFYGTKVSVVGMDPNGFFMDMPLTSRLYFLNYPFSESPEEIVDGLLTQLDKSN